MNNDPLLSFAVQVDATHGCELRNYELYLLQTQQHSHSHARVQFADDLLCCESGCSERRRKHDPSEAQYNIPHWKEGV